MRRDELGSLLALLSIAETGSFTRAAGKLGTSQSALSHKVRRLEERLGVRLLHRTTRSVAPTDAGHDLLSTLQPALYAIQHKIETLTASKHKVAGTVRISSADHAPERLLWPALKRLLPHHPEVKVEVNVENGFVDIVAGRYDAGVRLGQNVERDMIALPIGGEERLVVVCSPDYLKNRSAPETPDDLKSHCCINRTLPTLGGVTAWEFEKQGRRVKARVTGQLTFNRPELIIEAALANFGVAYVLESQVQAQLSTGRLIQLLNDWAPTIAGYCLYYPQNRQMTAAFKLVKEALRHRAP